MNIQLGEKQTASLPSQTSLPRPRRMGHFCHQCQHTVDSCPNPGSLRSFPELVPKLPGSLTGAEITLGGRLAHHGWGDFGGVLPDLHSPAFCQPLHAQPFPLNPSGPSGTQDGRGCVQAGWAEQNALHQLEACLSPCRLGAKPWEHGLVPAPGKKECGLKAKRKGCERSKNSMREQPSWGIPGLCSSEGRDITTCLGGPPSVPLTLCMPVLIEYHL